MILIIVLTVIVSVLLVLVILAQNSKGGGLSSQFGGSGASNMIGVKKTSDLLEKITWGLAITLFVLAISSKFIAEYDTSDQGISSPSIDRAQQENNAPALDLGKSTDEDSEAKEESTDSEQSNSEKTDNNPNPEATPDTEQ